MKILSAESIRQADAYTVHHEPISSIDLMERAVTNLYSKIKPGLAAGQGIHIFAGTGNNGGDGLVLARLLKNDGYPVYTWIVEYSRLYSNEFGTNLERLGKNSNLAHIRGEEDIPDIGAGDLLIDAIFGSGLNRPVSGFTAALIRRMNESGAVIIAIDMPSGLYADKAVDKKKHAIVEADYTYSFEFPKLAFLMPENDLYAGRWEVVPIGLHAGFIEQLEPKGMLIEAALVSSMLRRRPKFSHKGSYGHAMLIAGSKTKMGAAILSAGACLRSGAGLLHVHVPYESHVALQSHYPEAMISFDESGLHFSKLPSLSAYNAIGIGPGLGTHEHTSNALKLLIQQSRLPVVFDADALTILGENKTWLSFLPAGSILTPHPLEFERLAGKFSDGFERLQLQIDFSLKHKIYVVCKGAHTCITTPQGTSWFNTTGNPGMATAGSGDVLTGLITGLLAQGYKPFEAAVMGVFLHGLAGDIAADDTGMEGLIASDLIKHLPRAFTKLK
jgi:ADP-dependent NAD(P)H-hydrate dehydratase / NAD(P)H-hydrate epimerase